MQKFAYHQWSGADLRRHFKVDFEEGLTAREAILRSKKYGLNSFESERKNPFWTILLRQFTNFFIILLALATAITILTEGFSSSIVFIVIILLNVGVGFFQEFKAERSLTMLERSVESVAKVIRDGKVKVVNSENLVPGDVVLVSEGDRIPTDLRIIEERSLRVDESSLTGESMPVSKHEQVLHLDTPLAERINMAYMGTTALAGSARGVVVAIGKECEIGKIASLIEKVEEKTPLEENILYIGKIISYVAISIALAVFGLGLLQGWNPLELTSYVIALIVASVPESLPTVITLTLAIGVINMVKKNAIVRRMGVIEALGSVNVILTDKTGTITKNELSVTRYGFVKNGEKIIYDANLPHSKRDKELLYFAAICSDAEGEKHNELVGDPLEIAILRKLMEESNESFKNARKFERLTGYPFDSDKKYMMVEGKVAGERWIVMKGAVESIIPYCKLNDNDKKMLQGVDLELANFGMKNIAVSAKKINGKSLGNLKNLEFLGIISFSDEPCEGVAEALASGIKAGVRPVILTGDHPNTAKFIAESVGFPVLDSEIISGSEISELSDRELMSKIKKVKIFARATPEDKIRVVEIFKKAGYVVAVTGDGVNDAPALKAATVGIAMGIRGNDVAKESADIILSDDNYKTIIHAIAYGRQIYINIKNAITFLLASNFVETSLIALAFLFALPAPLTTIQILWINLVTDSLPAIALAFEKPGKNLLLEKPQADSKHDLTFALKYALQVGLFSLIIIIGIYLFGLEDSIAKARTLAFATIVLSQMALIMSVRSKKRIWESIGSFFENLYLNVAVLISLLIQIVAFLPVTREFFGTASLEVGDVILILLGAFVIFVGSEILRHRHDSKAERLKNKKSKVIENARDLIADKANI